MASGKKQIPSHTFFCHLNKGESHQVSIFKASHFNNRLQNNGLFGVLEFFWVWNKGFFWPTLGKEWLSGPPSKLSEWFWYIESDPFWWLKRGMAPKQGPVAFYCRLQALCVFVEVASLYGYYLRLTPYFNFCCQGYTPWVPPPLHTHGGKRWIFGPNRCDLPLPYFGIGEFKYTGIFRFWDFFLIFAYWDSEKKIWRRKGATTIFFWENHTCFWGHAPHK